MACGYATLSSILKRGELDSCASIRPPTDCSCVSEPSSICMILSANPNSLGSWVTTRTALPRSLAIAERIVMMAWPFAASSAAVGSSARIAEGSATMARAIATRCCSPPLSCRGKDVIFDVKPTLANGSESERGAAAQPTRPGSSEGELALEFVARSQRKGQAQYLPPQQGCWVARDRDGFRSLRNQNPMFLLNARPSPWYTNASRG